MINEALFQEREGYQALLQSVADYVVAVNRNYQIIMANDLFKDRFDLQDETFCFKAWKDRDERCLNCPVEKAFNDGQIHETEETVLMRDGQAAKMRIKATPVKDARGKIAYVLETATDTTERENLQLALNRIGGDMGGLIAMRLRYLQESEERYRTIFERSGEGILLTDSAGKILEINRAGVDILGYGNKKAVLQERSALELFQNKEDLSRLLKRLFKAGFVKGFEARLLGHGERVFDALVTSNVILDNNGQVTGYVMLITDITTRKEAYERIEIQNTRLATLNAIAMTVSNSLDLNQVMNRTAHMIREMIGSDFIRIYLLDARREQLHLAAHRGLSPEFIAKPHVMVRKVGDGFLGKTVQDGKVTVVDNLLPSEDPYLNDLVVEGFKSATYIPLVAGGEPVGMMCVSSRTPFTFTADFVEFLEAAGNQIGVAVHNAGLHESLKRAYEELRDAQEQVIRSEKLASLGKLSATIAHEINNPIAAVLTYIRLLEKLVALKRFTPERLEDVSRYLTIMEGETVKCGEIVKNLLTFSRQSSLRIETHPIEEIIQKTIPLISHDLGMKAIGLVKEVAPNLPRIQCDFWQIQQALLNLMINASEAMTKGGTLSVIARRSDDLASVEVIIRDTGSGILEKDMKNIFEPFFTTKEEGRGVGLGLSVVYGIIERHNGSIDVESEPGKGSTFRIRLPALG